MDDSSLLSIRINLEVLITDREAMIVENQMMTIRGEWPVHLESDFHRLSNAIRDLKQYF